MCYDEKMNWLGVAPRSEVHAKGLWHRHFNVGSSALEEKVPKLLLQLRHPEKDLFPEFAGYFLCRASSSW